jgi:Class II flagellar assembly regulator
MKVSNVGSGVSTSGARRTDKTSGSAKGAFKQALNSAMDTLEEAQAFDGPSAMGGVETLWAVQAMGDSTERESRRRLVQRGEDILDRLEEVRHCLLMGTIPKDKLEQLTQMIRARREACSDPRLGNLLDDIELRAEVELAKLSRGT